MKKITFRTDILPLKDKFYRLALRITTNTADAEDIVQEALIRIWKKREQWDEIESLETYGLAVTRNIALDYIKKSKTALHVPLDNEIPAKEYDKLQAQERINLIKNMMDSLPEKQRTAMQLRDFEEKTYKEVAEIMDISEQQVKVNIFRARQFIKQKIQENGL